MMTTTKAPVPTELLQAIGMAKRIRRELLVLKADGPFRRKHGATLDHCLEQLNTLTENLELVELAAQAGGEA